MILKIVHPTLINELMFDHLLIYTCSCNALHKNLTKLPQHASTFWQPAQKQKTALCLNMLHILNKNLTKLPQHASTFWQTCLNIVATNINEQTTRNIKEPHGGKNA